MKRSPETGIDCQKRSEVLKKVGNIFIGDQVAFLSEDNKLLFGTVTGFGHKIWEEEPFNTEPYLKTAEHPSLQVRVSRVERLTNKCRISDQLRWELRDDE